MKLSPFLCLLCYSLALQKMRTPSTSSASAPADISGRKGFSSGQNSNAIAPGTASRTLQYLLYHRILNPSILCFPEKCLPFLFTTE